MPQFVPATWHRLAAVSINADSRSGEKFGRFCTVASFFIVGSRLAFTPTRSGRRAVNPTTAQHYNPTPIASFITMEAQMGFEKG